MPDRGSVLSKSYGCARISWMNTHSFLCLLSYGSHQLTPTCIWKNLYSCLKVPWLPLCIGLKGFSTTSLIICAIRWKTFLLNLNLSKHFMTFCSFMCSCCLYVDITRAFMVVIGFIKSSVQTVSHLYFILTFCFCFYRTSVFNHVFCLSASMSVYTSRTYMFYDVPSQKQPNNYR